MAKTLSFSTSTAYELDYKPTYFLPLKRNKLGPLTYLKKLMLLQLSGAINAILLFLSLLVIHSPQVVSEDEHSQNQGNQSPNTGSMQSSPRRVRSETMFLERAAPLLRRMRHSQSLAFEKRLAPEPKPTIERFLEA